MPGYLEEEGANKSSHTETFVAIRVDIDNWRWAGVPFYLRTGKRLPTKCSEVVVYFKTPELNLFKETWQELPQNKLTIRLQPDEGVDIQVLNKVPGLDHKHNLQITKLDLSYSETFNQTHLADAYERLLLETMRGIQALVRPSRRSGRGVEVGRFYHRSLGCRSRFAETLSGGHLGAGCLRGDDHPRWSFVE